MRTAAVARKTNETDISATLELDRPGKPDISTGCGFLDHMLALFAKHGNFGLAVRAAGDTDVDFHHLTEDVGIVLGQAFREALGDCRGIARYGSALLPMDEALVLVALDVSGRAYLEYSAAIAAPKVGEFDTELAREFMLAFSRAIPLTLHVRQLAGVNAHHIIEAMFKGLARAMRQAVAIGAGVGIGGTGGVGGMAGADGADGCEADDLPSTKGLLL
jgi:imidazoleglycerol-phosphate dehydratase